MIRQYPILEQGVWGILAPPFAGADFAVDHASLTRRTEGVVAIKAQSLPTAPTIALLASEVMEMPTALRAALDAHLQSVKLPVRAGILGMEVAR